MTTTTPEQSPPTTSLDLVPLRATWLDMNGTGLKAGTAVVSIPSRLTSQTDGSIIPGGVWWSGALNTTPGSPSLAIDVPATDDPAIRETGWLVNVDVTFADGAHEHYAITVPLESLAWVPPGVDLKDETPSSKIPVQTALLKMDSPGGLAVHQPDGSLRNPITGAILVPGDASSADFADFVTAFDAALGGAPA